MDWKTKYTLIFSVVYGVSLISLSPYLLSWGSKPTWWESILNFFVKFPVDWASLIANNSLAFIMVNIGFWCLVFYLILTVIEKFK